MTALPVLGVVNNDKRETLSFIFQVGLPALEKCIKKKQKLKIEDIQLEKGYCCYGKTWICNTSTAGSWSAPGTAAHRHYSSFPEGSKASFLDLHGSIIASIWQDSAVDKDEWKQAGKWENTPCASAPLSTSLLSPDQSSSLIGFPTLQKEPHNNKQQVQSPALCWASPSSRSLCTHCSLPGWASLCIFCSFFPWALQSRK